MKTLKVLLCPQQSKVYSLLDHMNYYFGNRKFYRDSIGLMHIRNYKEFINGDLALMETLVLPCTVVKLKEMAQKYLVKYTRHYVEHKLKRYLEHESIKKEGTSEKDVAEV